MNTKRVLTVTIYCDCGKSSVIAEGPLQIRKLRDGEFTGGVCTHCKQRMGPPWPIGIRGVFRVHGVVAYVGNHPEQLEQLPMFRPSVSIADAWRVVEKMQSEGWDFDLRNFGTWTAQFSLRRDMGATVISMDADTAPLAICRAVLAATAAVEGGP